MAFFLYCPKITRPFQGIFFQTHISLIVFCHFLFNRRWHVSTTPNTSKTFCFCSPNCSNYLIWSSRHSELPREEKSRLEPEEKKLSLLLKREIFYCLWHENSTLRNKLNFFFSGSNFNFYSVF